MGGKSGGSQTLGYWYHVGYHHLISATEFDAFLEFRGGDKTAWSGEIDASGTITINAPNLWGGEKDQGGIVGDADIMFGEATQGQNAYLVSAFGSQVPNWRGVGGVVFKGGKFGAMNPYPQKPSYKIRRITKGWDNDTCWYSAKAEIVLAADTVLPADATGWQYVTVPHVSNPGYNSIDIPTSGWTDAPLGPWSDARETPANTWWPARTDIWFKRSITGTTAGLVCQAAADNGCLLFANGALFGASNRANLPIANNENYPVNFPVSAGKTYEIAVKVYCEELDSDDYGNVCSISMSAPGLTAMNPAHMLYDALTAQDMLAEPTANIDDTSFQTAADWFYSQGFGLCTAYDPDSETPEDFRKRIETVAGCSCNRSPIDGKWYLDIANGVYTLADLPILTDDDILEFDDAPTSVDAAVNSLSIEYNDVQQKVTVTTPPTQALALVRSNGLNHDVHKYHEIPTSDLATRVAVRDLRALVTPTKTFSLTTTRKPYAWRRNTYFRLQAPKRDISDMVCLLAEKSSGTLKSGAMTITATEDIYSLPSAGFTNVEAGVDTSSPQTPLAIMQQAAFEAPYVDVVTRLSRADLSVLPADVGYAMTVAADPGQSRDYSITVSTDGGTSYVDVGNGPFTPSAQIVEGDTLQDGLKTAFTLANSALLESVAVGSGALWQNTDGTFELCKVAAIDVGANTITLARGCADTVPAPHAANALIWFYQTAAGYDSTEYTDAETVDIELLTNTGTAQLDAGLASPVSLTFAQRQYLPYPPGNVQVNAAFYPSSIGGSDAIAITGAHRDRVSQADQLIDITQTDVGPESGTTYTLRLYNELDALVRTEAAMASPNYTWITGDEESDSGIASGEPPALWTPADLATPPAFWVNDTSEVQTAYDSSYASRWSDARSNGCYWGSSSANTVQEPIITASGQNGLRVLTFDGSNDLMPGNSNAKALIQNIGAAALFVAANPSQATSTKRLLVFSINSNGNVRAGIYLGLSSNTVSASQRRNDTDSAVGATMSQPDSNFHIYESEHNWTGQSVGIRMDGGTITTASTSQGSGNCANSASSEVGLFGSPSTSGQYATGTCGEVIVLQHIPSDADRQLIEGYLAWKWGIEANLPAGHPYKSAAPTTGGTGGYRLNGKVRFELESQRDGVTSFQHHNITVRRNGYGFNYGMFYGGAA